MFKSILLAFALLFAGGAAAADIPYADFARHAQFQDVKISPDGESIAAIAVSGGRNVLVMIHLADRKTITVRPRGADDCCDNLTIPATGGAVLA